MSPADRTITIGNVLRADIRGFVVASRIPAPEVPTFGAFVRAPIQQETAELIGLVYDIRLLDDPFLRNLATSVFPGDPRSEEIIRDQRENRAVPVEIAVVSVGFRYKTDTFYTYGLPPQPPMILHEIAVCSGDEVRAITASPEFMRALVDNRDIPADELLPAVLLQASSLRAPERMDYLLRAGKYLAQELARDPVRLDRILRRIDHA
ncbi:MAG: hypothetical protein ACYCYF_08750 [Anaerolineae bacterium]